jgi:glycine cleavage system pyridoxal-binding protein P
VLTPRPFYNEFVLRTGLAAGDVRHRLVDNQLLAGVPLDAQYGEPNGLLLAFTERNTREQIDRLVQAVGEVLA